MTNQAYNLGLAGVGQDVQIWPKANIIAPEVITIGDSVIIDDFVVLIGGTKTTIGSFVHIASFVLIGGGGECVIEDFVGISGGCHVYSGNDDYLGSCLTGPTVPFPYRVAIRSSVHFGKHAIIGANSVILPGVTIGEGVAVGAGALITKDLEPWTIYVGSPAHPLRARPKEKILELEAQLREELYDSAGKYIPNQTRAERG